jgi:hypothetical protein
MLKRIAAVASVVLLLLPAAALGETYTSEEFGFTADFPAAPVVGQPQGSEKDGNGNFISTSVSFTAAEQGVYAAIVSVESYSVPVKLDIDASLAVQRDSFVKGLNASVSSSAPGKQDGHPALFFSYDTPGHSMVGDGIVAYVETDKPRSYIVVTMETAATPVARTADLDRFLRTFHIK